MVSVIAGLSQQKPKKRIFINFVYESDLLCFNLLHAWSKNQSLELEFYSESVRDPFSSGDAKYLREKIIKNSPGFKKKTPKN